MRFVVDVNLSPEWTDLLAAQGHDTVHWRDVGATDTPDDDILAWAVQEDRIVFTADLDFATAVATRGLSAPSVVQMQAGSTDPLVVGGFVARSILTIDPSHARLRPGFGAIV